jgi:hypothetical protein
MGRSARSSGQRPRSGQRFLQGVTGTSDQKGLLAGGRSAGETAGKKPRAGRFVLVG